MVAAVATGAFAAAAAGQTLHSDQTSEPETASPEVTPLASAHYASASMGIGGRAPTGAPPALLPVSTEQDPAAEAQQLLQSEQITQERKAQEAAAAREAAEPDYVLPTQGRLSSPYGGRWGSMHYGIDFANSIGTPIRAVSDGVVIEAGPASGFGLWVRIRNDDGTVSVYGHIHSYSVSEGERVEAGEMIAKMGSRGHSTGPHLHFEIWNASGQKINPLTWLNQHGVYL